MNFINLTVLEFFLIFLPLSLAVVALYLYDRSRRRQVISTLQFWPKQPDPPMVTRRRKIQQPWSLLLQLLVLMLLLLAIADLQWDGGTDRVKRHVVILDSSAWMGALTPGGQSLLTKVSAFARSYIASVPDSEPLMLIRGDANPTPMTPFTTDRRVLEEAIQTLTPSWNSIDLGAAFGMARSVLKLHISDSDGSTQYSNAGEVTYIGSSRSQVSNTIEGNIPTVRWIEVDEQIEDRGITDLVARRAAADSEIWEVSVEFLSTAERAEKNSAEFLFAGKKLGSKTFILLPNNKKKLRFRMRTRRAGRLEIRMSSPDRFALNDSAFLELPKYYRHPIDVYSRHSHVLKSLVDSNSSLDAKFFSLQNYVKSQAQAIIFEKFAPTVVPQSNLVYISPPSEGSPVRVERLARKQRIIRWNEKHPLAQGLRTKDIVLDETAVFNPSSDDIVIAECEAGPVIIAQREDDHKRVLFGFAFSGETFQNTPAAPLLFANTMRWIFPDSYQSSELRAQSPGLIEVDVGDTVEGNITVHSDRGHDIPWSYRSGRLRLFTSTPDSIVIETPTVRTHLAVVLPGMHSGRWSPSNGVLRGVPPSAIEQGSQVVILWPFFVILALLFSLLEWRLFGRTAGRLNIIDVVSEKFTGARSGPDVLRTVSGWKWIKGLKKSENLDSSNSGRNVIS